MAEALVHAAQLVLGLDGGLLRVVGLSLLVSLGATAGAALIGLPLGAALAIWRFPGRGGVVLVANALLGLPPVVVGLALYLLLSRAGPLGAFGLLFTPGAMVLAQVLLALPDSVRQLAPEKHLSQRASRACTSANLHEVVRTGSRSTA